LKCRDCLSKARSRNFIHTLTRANQSSDRVVWVCFCKCAMANMLKKKWREPSVTQPANQARRLHIYIYMYESFCWIVHGTKFSCIIHAKAKKTMKHNSCKICDETIRSWMMLCISCIITDDKSSHLTLSNSLMNRHVACLQGRGCVAEEPYWKIRKWCYCCSLLTNVCNHMHTGPRAGSNPSKNFASTTGEVVNSGDRGEFLKERCSVTATGCSNLQPHATVCLQTLARMMAQCVFAVLLVAVIHNDERMWSVTIALTASDAKHQDFRIHT